MSDREQGQALIEAVLALPVCLAAALAIVGCGILVRDRLAVTDAADRAAQAQLSGGDATAAARRALPDSLRADARVKISGDRVQVIIRSRTHVPGMAHVTQRSEAVTTAGGVR